MAEVKEVVIFEVDVSAYEKSLVDLTKSINGLKDAQTGFAEQAKAGSTEAAKKYEQVTAQLKIQQQEYRTTQNVLVGYNGALQKNVNTLDFSKNSIQANRDLLKQYTAQIINTVNPSEKLTSQVKKLSDTLSKQELALGDGRRGVGKYAEGILAAFKNLQGIGGAVDPVVNLAKAFKAGEGGVQGFSAALATTGLPLVIAGVNLLIDAFKAFKPVADGIEDAVTGIKAAFNALISGGDIGKAVESSLALLNVLRDLEDTQGAFNIQNEKYRNEIQRLIVASKDRTKSDKDRLDFVAKANELEEKAFADGKKRLDDEIRARAKNFIEKNKISIEDYNLITRGTTKEALALRERLEKSKAYSEEELKVLQDKIKERTSLEGESLVLQEKLANNTNKLLDELQAEKDKRDATAKAKQDKIDADRKKAAEDEIARLNKVADENARLEKLRIETIETGQQKERDLFQLDFENKIADLIKAGLTEQQIEEVKQRGLKEIDDKYDALRLKSEEDVNAQILQVKEDAARKAQEMADNAIKSQKSQAQDIVGYVIQAAQAAASFIGEIGNALAQTSQQNIDDLQEQVKVGAITQKQFQAQAREEKLKAFKEAKAINIVMAVMNTANAVMAQISNPTPYVGFVLAALAAATGAAQIAIIARQKPPKFARGVIGLNGAGNETSDSIDAKLSKGESVITARATKRYHRELAEMEMSVGNVPNYNFSSRKFATGVIGDGGFTTRDISANVDQAQILKSAIKEGFTSSPAPVVSITEFNTKSKAVNKSVRISEL